jgi:hypothetical protein
MRLEIMRIHLPKMQSSQEQLWCSKLLSSTANNNSQGQPMSVMAVANNQTNKYAVFSSHSPMAKLKSPCTS